VNAPCWKLGTDLRWACRTGGNAVKPVSRGACPFLVFSKDGRSRWLTRENEMVPTEARIVLGTGAGGWMARHVTSSAPFQKKKIERKMQTTTRGICLRRQLGHPVNEKPDGGGARRFSPPLGTLTPPSPVQPIRMEIPSALPCPRPVVLGMALCMGLRLECPLPLLSTNHTKLNLPDPPPGFPSTTFLSQCSRKPSGKPMLLLFSKGFAPSGPTLAALFLAPPPGLPHRVVLRWDSPGTSCLPWWSPRALPMVSSLWNVPRGIRWGSCAMGRGERSDGFPLRSRLDHPRVPLKSVPRYPSHHPGRWIGWEALCDGFRRGDRGSMLSFCAPLGSFFYSYFKRSYF
jgi:hypothetical protein